MGIDSALIGKSGTLTWESPSNIALIKYWGKHGRQYPRNASISFTLQHAKTITTCHYKVLDRAQEEIQLDFKFEGKPNEAFANKIKKYFTSIKDQVSFMDQVHFSIESENTFPHSTGIASSASAMSALALILCTLEEELIGKIDDFTAKASLLARLGSGSASRSVLPQLSIWGKHEKIENSRDEYAIPFGDHVDPIFHTYHDDILIVSKKEKSVSSTAGHALMNGNPYAETRYQAANDQLERLTQAMQSANLDIFIEIVENEALSLHALMMCSNPSFILLEPNTLAMIEEIRRFRAETKVPVCFTLDAGPNIHLLYPNKYYDQVNVLIQDRLIPLTQDGMIIRDQVGMGPKYSS